jgi:cytochrome c biogenesis factor
MRNALLLAGLLVLVLGMFLARDRVRLAFQVGAVLYAVSIVVRFFIFGFGDRDDVLNVIVVGAVMLLIWLVTKAIVEAILERRRRKEEPPT